MGGEIDAKDTQKHRDQAVQTSTASSPESLDAITDTCTGTCFLGSVVHGSPPYQQDHEFMHPQYGPVTGVRVSPCSQKGCANLYRDATAGNGCVCTNRAIIETQALRQFEEQMRVRNLLYGLTLQSRADG